MHLTDIVAAVVVTIRWGTTVWLTLLLIHHFGAITIIIITGIVAIIVHICVHGRGIKLTILEPCNPPFIFITEFSA